MYYSFPCPKCGELISAYEEDPDDEYYAPRKLFDLVKQHFKDMHTPEDLLQTDEELLYEIEENTGKSEEEPLS
jgi:hypothetical protein